MIGKNERIMVVVAHPDDEVLGCGGTIARSIRRGGRVSVLILGEGITARDSRRDIKKRKKEIEDLKKQANMANGIMGVGDIFIGDLPDNRFDEAPLLDVVKTIERHKKKFHPNIIYTHHRGDLNVDHRITFNAVLTVCRPIPGEEVKEIYSFETPSSTEWNYPYSFSPNTFVDISETLLKKIEALKAYRSELRRFPHPRSEEAVRNMAKHWGSRVGFESAEAFEVIRKII